ncbi:uncharacterized protein [Lepeophtheirus salmonis]|uniref:uncharacterized protein n=1 Tax=Lepeophtheirus salmonis TaxID=72036 RepID=UPI001AEA9152|nr:uncharacterized protein LOC121129567 [Lepeophtheirus salmonis]
MNGNNNYESEISSGSIPGIAQKDYPVNSPASLLKKNPTKYKGIQHAPSFLIPKNYPKNKLPPRPQNLPSNLPKSKSPNAGGSNEGQSAQPLLINNANNNQKSSLEELSDAATNFNYCRGGSLDECINFCPGHSQDVYSKCVEGCGRFCGQ